MWKLCYGIWRCEKCGQMAEPTWRFWATPTTSTHCLCEACATKAMKEVA